MTHTKRIPPVIMESGENGSYVGWACRIGERPVVDNEFVTVDPDCVGCSAWTEAHIRTGRPVHSHETRNINQRGDDARAIMRGGL